MPPPESFSAPRTFTVLPVDYRHNNRKSDVNALPIWTGESVRAWCRQLGTMDDKPAEAQFKKSLRGGDYIPMHPKSTQIAMKSKGGAPIHNGRYIVIPKALQNLPERPTIKLKIVLE